MEAKQCNTGLQKKQRKQARRTILTSLSKVYELEVDVWSDIYNVLYSVLLNLPWFPRNNICYSPLFSLQRWLETQTGPERVCSGCRWRPQQDIRFHQSPSPPDQAPCLRIPLVCNQANGILNVFNETSRHSLGKRHLLLKDLCLVNYSLIPLLVTWTTVPNVHFLGCM